MEDEERMARNVEIKAVARDFMGQQRLAAAVAADGPRVLVQHDVFYRVPQGRLKLRRFAEGNGELIQYDRPDELGSKTCSYVVVPVERPGELHTALSRALGVLVEVRKRRTLYMVGRTRVHFDEVEGLERLSDACSGRSLRLRADGCFARRRGSTNPTPPRSLPSARSRGAAARHTHPKTAPGQFIELEVVLREGEDEAVGHGEAKALMARLGIGQEDLVAGAYGDMRRLV